MILIGIATASTAGGRNAHKCWIWPCILSRVPEDLSHLCRAPNLEETSLPLFRLRSGADSHKHDDALIPHGRDLGGAADADAAAAEAVGRTILGGAPASPPQRPILQLRRPRKPGLLVPRRHGRRRPGGDDRQATHKARMKSGCAVARTAECCDQFNRLVDKCVSM